MNEQLAKNVGPAHLDLAWAEAGDPRDPTVLLIMGLAAQLIHWPEGFVDALVARGLHVVRFDNRDAGRSTHLHDAPAPNFMAALQGDLSSASYSLSDMAADAVGLLDVLKLEAVHVVGASMGAGIAQTMAIEHPARVRSLTSMMWTTGASTVGQMHPETQKVVFSGPAAKTREAVIARSLRSAAFVGSPAYPTDPAALADVAGRAFDRDHDELGPVRQGLAVLASGDRTEKLKKVKVPTLVLHGLADTMVDPSGGRATAAAIPGAELELIEGMGHNLPPGLWNRIADLIARGASGQRGRACETSTQTD